jgi:putative phosphoesterase
MITERICLMKVAVFSDTHSNIELCLEAVRRTQPDVIIHLGDHDRDAISISQEFPEIPMYYVCGNCDIAPLAPVRSTVQLGPVKAFITHGHLYNVDFNNVDSLVYAARENEASLVLFGHTHRVLYDTVGGVTVINPGTAGKGRRLTYALLDIMDNGGIGCTIKDL